MTRTYRAAGILPHHRDRRGQRWFLLGQERESGLWCDFGGRRSRSDSDCAETAAREAFEESRGVLGEPDALAQDLADASRIHNERRGYMLHLLHLETRLRHREGRRCDCMRCAFHDSGRVDDGAVFREKSDVRWFSSDELRDELREPRNSVLRGAFIQTCRGDLRSPTSALRPIVGRVWGRPRTRRARRV